MLNPCFPGFNPQAAVLGRLDWGRPGVRSPADGQQEKLANGAANLRGHAVSRALEIALVYSGDVDSWMVRR